jgi:hypothetical protein
MNIFVQYAFNLAQKRKLVCLALSASLLLLPALCLGECKASVYAFSNLVVFNDCTSDGTPQLNVVVLDDAAPLRVNGRVTLPSQRGIDAFAHAGDQLIVLRWDRLEIYDLQDVAHPTLAASFQLKNSGETRGYPRIEESAAGSFLVLSAVGAAELKHQGDQAKWTVNELPARDEFRRKMSDWPPEHRFADDSKPTLLRETAKFRYVLAWRYQSKPGEAIGWQYVRKVAKTSGRMQSQLLVRQTYETID